MSDRPFGSRIPAFRLLRLSTKELQADANETVVEQVYRAGGAVRVSGADRAAVISRAACAASACACSTVVLIASATVHDSAVTCITAIATESHVVAGARACIGEVVDVVLRRRYAAVVQIQSEREAV